MKTMQQACWVVLAATCTAGAVRAQVPGATGPTPGAGFEVRTCRVEPPPWATIKSYAGGSGGGMNGDGWDGGGEGSALLTWHMEGSTPDMATGQRQALIGALQAWANVANISFVEVPVANLTSSIDFHFVTGDHSNIEPHEQGDPDCPFDNAGGTYAHAGFPPDAAGTCGGGSQESYAGNVHFDEMETWSTVINSGDAGLDLLTVAVHEVGHAIGLTHSTAPDIMRPSFAYQTPYGGVTQNDINNLLSGYASGQGFVQSLEQIGVWVNWFGFPPYLGTQSSPFLSIPQGIEGVPPSSTGVELHISAGTYAYGGLVIDRSMLLVAENGSAVIQ